MIIGFSGNARSGKDFSCSLLQEMGKARGVNFQRMAFADKLKISAHESLGIYFDTLKEHLDFSDWFKLNTIINVNSDHEISGRDYYVKFGESHRNIFGEDFWVKQTISGNLHNRDVIFTDVRYPNEAEKILSFDGYIVNIERSDSEDSPDIHKLPESLIDFNVINNKDKDALTKELKVIFDSIYNEESDYKFEDYEHTNKHKDESEW